MGAEQDISSRKDVLWPDPMANVNQPHLIAAGQNNALHRRDIIVIGAKIGEQGNDQSVLIAGSLLLSGFGEAKFNP